MLKHDIVNCLREHCNEEKEVSDIEGSLYMIYESLRDCLTKYNDTLRGRCSVCLEPFCENEADLET